MLRMVIFRLADRLFQLSLSVLSVTEFAQRSAYVFRMSKPKMDIT